MALREYKDQTPIEEFYRKLYLTQNHQETRKQRELYHHFDHEVASMSEILKRINTFVDPSDPDLDLPNHLHAYGTAEMIRAKHPENFEYQVVGLIHDLGKILFSYGLESEWIVGDTFVLGCPFPKSMVYYDLLKQNQDWNKTEFNATETGIYPPKCGLDQLEISYGHDEYLYGVLVHNREKHHLSDKYLKVIRYHSLYPLHKAGEYRELLSEEDREVVEDLKDFNQYDLYSKGVEDFKITPEIEDYYEKLLTKYFPEPLEW